MPQRSQDRTRGITGGGGLAPVPKTLLNYYTFEETTGVRRDSVGHLDLQVIGASPGYAAGKNGNALSFTADVDNHLRNDGFVWYRQKLSISVWTYWTSLGTGSAKLCCSTPYIDPGANSCQFYYSSSGQLAFLISGSSVGSTTSPVTSGSWHHLVFVYDGTQPVEANRIALYCDNVALGTSFLAGIISTVMRSPLGGIYSGLAVGSEGYGQGWQSAFLMDELAIFNWSLSPAEVSDLWNAGAGKFYPI